MARIILGIASSHSPQVSTPADKWHVHVDRDRESPYLDFAALTAASTHDIDDQLEIGRMRAKDEACQAAIAELALTLEDAAPDVLVVIATINGDVPRRRNARIRNLPRRRDRRYEPRSAHDASVHPARLLVPARRAPESYPVHAGSRRISSGIWSATASTLRHMLSSPPEEPSVTRLPSCDAV